jgi:hypothetical protein
VSLNTRYCELTLDFSCELTLDFSRHNRPKTRLAFRSLRVEHDAPDDFA